MKILLDSDPETSLALLSVMKNSPMTAITLPKLQWAVLAAFAILFAAFGCVPSGTAQGLGSISGDRKSVV